jgi:hypothetical protein
MPLPQKAYHTRVQTFDRSERLEIVKLNYRFILLFFVVKGCSRLS